MFTRVLALTAFFDSSGVESLELLESVESGAQHVKDNAFDLLTLMTTSGSI